VIFGTKNGIGRDQVISVKRMSDGSTIYVEEMRKRNKELATVSMRKYPATKDFDSIAGTLPSNARGDGGNKPIILQSPSVDKGETEGSGGEVLHQPADGGTRGWFRVLPDGSYEIGKTKIGDLSTFVHEPGHAYLKIIGDLAKRDGASDTIKGDYQKILDFLGAKDGETLTREQQETWARANEQYLREGNAPSAGLKGVFQRFALWLHSVLRGEM
jgi:hypothetical protein